MTDDEVSGEPLPGQLVFADAAQARGPWRRRLLIAAGSVALLLLLGAGSVAGYLAWTNKERAERWQERALLLEGNVEALEDVVLTRTQDLNERTAELNQMASKVRRAERGIARSEADVKNLERRQRQLASEKAQVEDARAALALQALSLEDIASAYIQCKDGLTDLLNYVLSDDFYSATAIVNGVQFDCDAAESQLSSYYATYG